jgi:heat shock protein HslJ
MVAVLALLAALLGSCGITRGMFGAGPYADGTWRLVTGTSSGEPLPIVAGSEPTMTISGTAVSGRSGCNQYGGTLTAHAGRIAFGALEVTEMACDEPRMTSEAAYLAALSAITTDELGSATLRLSGAGVELTFARVPPD